MALDAPELLQGSDSEQRREQGPDKNEQPWKGWCAGVMGALGCSDCHPKASLSLEWRQEARTAVRGPRGLCLEKTCQHPPCRGLTPVSTRQDIPVFLPENDSDKSDPPAPPLS